MDYMPRIQSDDRILRGRDRGPGKARAIMITAGTVCILKEVADNYADPDRPFDVGELVYVTEVQESGGLHSTDRCKIVCIHNCREGNVPAKWLVPSTTVWSYEYFMSEDRLNLMNKLNK